MQDMMINEKKSISYPFYIYPLNSKWFGWNRIEKIKLFEIFEACFNSRLISHPLLNNRMGGFEDEKELEKISAPIKSLLMSH